MACTCDDVAMASWWTVGGRSFPSELEDAVTATAEIQALKEAHRKTWASGDYSRVAELVTDVGDRIVERAGVTIVGISRDSLAAHEKFREQMKFPFALLSDADSLVCKQFDVIREKNMYGRKVMGIERSTFLLDAQGVLRHQWRKLKVDGHALQVLETAQAL